MWSPYRWILSRLTTAEASVTTLQSSVAALQALFTSGSWTPALAGATTPGTQTYSTQTGSYYKIDKLVFVEGTVVLTALDGATAGDMHITGLPFVVSGVAAASAVVDDVDIFQGGGWFYCTARFASGQSYIELLQAGDSVPVEALDASDMNADTAVTVSGCYVTT